MKRCFSYVFVAFLLAVMAQPVFAQNQPDSTKADPAKGKPEMRHGRQHGMHGPAGQGMTAKCKEMMAKHKQRMSMMKEMNKTLQEKVAVMNAAMGEKKIAAMAAVINELVNQREKMMGHMMERMGEENRKSMAECPMMQQMMQGEAAMENETASQGENGKKKDM